LTVSAYRRRPITTYAAAGKTRQITITDEGLDGLHLHVINETAEPLNGYVELLLLKDSHVVVARKEISCQLPRRARQTFESDDILDRFYDVSYAYRFGPPKHDVVIATLYDEQHNTLSEAVSFLAPARPRVVIGMQLGSACRGDGRRRLSGYNEIRSLLAKRVL